MAVVVEQKQVDTRTIEPVSRQEQRSAAAERRATYPYKFPRDGRKIGGKFSVEENARRLLRWFYIERRLAHGLGSWTLTIPDFEVKIETGRHIFWHMDAARKLRDRLLEQETRKAAIDDFRDAEIDALIDEALRGQQLLQLGEFGFMPFIDGPLSMGKQLQNEIALRNHLDEGGCGRASEMDVLDLLILLLAI